MSNKNDRILGLFFGQLIGDAIGTRYEFLKKTKARQELEQDIKNNNNKIRILGGGHFFVNKGQYTDDSELALGIWYSLLLFDEYNIEDIVQQFYKWYRSEPFDIGNTTKNAFNRGSNRHDMITNANDDNKYSLSNGCLMKISPIGCINHLFGKSHNLSILAKEICELTNPNAICIDMCVCYVEAINTAIETGSPIQAYLKACKVAKTKIVKLILADAKTKNSPVKCIDSSGNIFDVAPDVNMGYIGIAFQNAFFHLLNTFDVTNNENIFDKVMINTILLGGDTDTNCCIVGALYCACHGVKSIKYYHINDIMLHKSDHNRTLIYPPLNHQNLYELLYKKLILLVNCTSY